MAVKLEDFFRGDTKRWRVVWPTDIAGAQILFTLRRQLDQAEPDLQIAAVLDAPDAEGKVYGATLEISAAASGQLAPGRYHCDHQITLAGGEVGTFGAQQIAVLPDVTR